MKITELTEEEKLYATKQSQQLRGQTGEIQCTFVVFDENRMYLRGEEYHINYDREAFSKNFNYTFAILEDEGFLKSQQDFIKYGKEHPEGVRIDNQGYTYITTFDPENGTAKMHIYQTEKLNNHIEEAQRGIKVRCGEETFVIKDGGKIAVNYNDGSEPVIRTARYIDPTHFELDGSSLGLYHRDEYAMIMTEHGCSVTPYDESEKMTVVMVKPGREAEITQIGTKLEDMQKVVGGYIEAIYPYDDEVAIVCNDEGKLQGLRPNRALYSNDEDGEVYDIIFGTYFVCGLGEDDFASLTPELAQKYQEEFRYPERFFFYDDKLVCEKMIPEAQTEKQSKGIHI